MNKNYEIKLKQFEDKKPISFDCFHTKIQHPGEGKSMKEKHPNFDPFNPDNFIFKNHKTVNMDTAIEHRKSHLKADDASK